MSEIITIPSEAPTRKRGRPAKSAGNNGAQGATGAASAAKAAKSRSLAQEKDHFRHKLILNAWLIREFGINPLPPLPDQAILPIRALGESIRHAAEGLCADGLHHFYHAFALSPQSIVTPTDLLRYEENIVRHTEAINAQRSRKIDWKYFQWLTLLFVERYLDVFFHRKHDLLDSLNAFVPSFNAWRGEQGFSTPIDFFTLDELNKICLQNATGSGKTLLMHVNLLQFHHAAAGANKLGEYGRVILLTPGFDLTEQHLRELSASGIAAARFVAGDLLSQTAPELARVDALEMSKLGDEDKENIVAVRNLGDSNLLLVDEGHVGLGSQNETGWLARRDALSAKGFVFEYSATFAQAVEAAKENSVMQAYAKSVLFDYSYRYFYEDGYGKDYRIFNLSGSGHANDATQRLYLTASLLSYYQQLRLFEEQRNGFADFNLEKPLWVFVGASVTKAMGGTKEEGATITDVARIVNFFADFLHERSRSASDIEALLTGNGQATGLLDEDGHDIFSSSFTMLKEKRLGGEDAADLYQDILKRIFQHAAGGTLTLTRIKGETAEVRLHAGTAERPFGVINVGDAPALVKVLEAQCPHVVVQDSEFASAALFADISTSNSPVNLLIGSRKFVSGWDCWRVSTLGLMHVGKSEGAQIIQLFGRGVRLKGHAWSLKRSSAVPSAPRPRHIELVETLGVFGVKSDYMQEFRKFLEQEGLPGNEKKETRTIPMNLLYDFGKQLMMLGPKTKKANGRKYDFLLDGPVPSAGDVPDKLTKNPVEVDWYPRIEAIVAKKDMTSTGQESKKYAGKLGVAQLAFIRWDAIWFALESYKRLRGWTNLNIDQHELAGLFDVGRDGWYTLLIPQSTLASSNWRNVEIWQRVATELLKRYIDAFYNHCKKTFYEPRLELKPLARDNLNLPADDAVYQLVVDASEAALLADIKLLEQEIKQSGGGLIGEHRDIKAYKLGVHLFSPLLHVVQGRKISIAPVPLNESEFDFVRDLHHFIDQPEGKEVLDGCEVFLLRNRSRGGGIGFFEAGSFYPDFILWIVRGAQQYVAFIEPHGLIHEGSGSQKILFHQTIKEIEQRVQRSGKKVTLESFIVTPTALRDLKWGMDSLGAFARQHVLFMKDDKDAYVKKLFEMTLSKVDGEVLDAA
ncbi:MAG: DEAD/DEAH box helicase family protein [Glaciimonas sp.]|nr:DEAD/DEAH box helicase family protein [Glaciimonas sp.]